MENTLSNRDLKIGLFKSPQCPGVEFEMYVIENAEDSKKFFKAFPENPKSMQKNFIKYLDEGRTVIVNDPNFTGFNSFCFESKETENVHPSAHIKIKMLN